FGSCSQPTPPRTPRRSSPASRKRTAWSCPPSFPRACHRTAAMRLRLTEIDRPLTAVVVALAAYGLATLYSAGQTDVPTFVTTIWQRQLIWLGVGLVAVVLMFRTSTPHPARSAAFEW